MDLDKMINNKICRLCMRKPAACFSMLDSNVLMMLEDLLSAKVNKDNEISSVICLKCSLSLKLAYNFQKLVKKNLRNFSRLNVRKQSHFVQVKSQTDGCSVDESSCEEVRVLDTSCPICGDDKEDNTKFNDHIRQHFKTKQECSTCDEVFPDIESLKAHSEQHEENVVHECNNCSAKFLYKSFYDLHVAVICSPLSDVEGEHNEDTPSDHQNEDKDCMDFLQEQYDFEIKTCGICKFQIRAYDFEKHMENHKVEPQICHICGAQLKNLTGLNFHIKRFHESQICKCEDCGKDFKYKTLLESHRRRIHLKKLKHNCHLCAMKFYCKTSLTDHIRTKHLKLKPYICEFCKRGFCSKYVLKTHRRQHTNETPYRCEICGEAFKQNVLLRLHRKSKHNIIEPETCKCEICGKGFASNMALRIHRICVQH